MFKNNPRLKTLELVESIMSGEEAVLLIGITIDDLAELKYAPIISTDVKLINENHVKCEN